MWPRTRGENGLTLLELLVALVISVLVIAAVYRTFVRQQKSYSIQEDVVDIQQNARVALNRMVSEVRMAGFGNVSMVLPVTFRRTEGGNVVESKYDHVVNPDPSGGAVTIVTAINSAANGTTLSTPSARSRIQVSRLKDDQNDPLFDLDNRKYISIDGVESNEIKSITPENKEIEFVRPLIYKHPAGTRVYPIRAISYQLLGRADSVGGGAQPLAENIERVQYQYLDGEGKEIADPLVSVATIRMIKVTVTAKTEKKDPDIPGSDGYRRRELSSNIHIRNIR